MKISCRLGQALWQSERKDSDRWVSSSAFWHCGLSCCSKCPAAVPVTTSPPLSRTTRTERGLCPSSQLSLLTYTPSENRFMPEYWLCARIAEIQTRILVLYLFAKWRGAACTVLLLISDQKSGWAWLKCFALLLLGKLLVEYKSQERELILHLTEMSFLS